MHYYNAMFTRDGSRFSNIRFNYRITIRLCDYFLKVLPGLDNKDCPIVKDARICHLPDRATAGGH